MFSVDSNITNTTIRMKNPYKVFFSMNIHQVTNPEMSLEDARSYVFFTREERETIAVCVGLHFLRSGRKLFYSHSANPFPEAEAPGIEDDARRFTEDLGAVLDGIDFSKMSDSEKAAWLGNLEILSDEKEVVVDRQEPAPAEAMPQSADAAGVTSVQAASSASFSETASVRPPESVQGPETVPAPVKPQSRITEASYERPALSQQAPVQGTDRKASGRRKRTEEDRPVQAVHRVTDDAVKAGEVKAPNARMKKDSRNAAGFISREKEALARLLASF